MKTEPARPKANTFLLRLYASGARLSVTSQPDHGPDPSLVWLPKQPPEAK